MRNAGRWTTRPARGRGCSDGGFPGRNWHVMTKGTDNGGVKVYLVKNVLVNGVFLSTWSQTDHGDSPAPIRNSYWLEGRGRQSNKP